MAYTIVAICILVLRYESEDVSYSNEKSSSLSQILRQMFNLNFTKQPNTMSSNIIKLTVVLFSIFSAILCLLIDTSWQTISVVNVLAVIVSVFMLICFVIIARQPKLDCVLTFQVPAVPLLPLISIFMNLYLMFQLDINTWIRFAIWIAIGYLIYFTYGMRQSVEGNREKLELSEHGRDKSDLEHQRYGRHMTPSVDDLRNANVEFVTGSTIQLSHQWKEPWTALK